MSPTLGNISQMNKLLLAAALVYASVSYSTMVFDEGFGALTFATISIVLLVPLIVAVLVVFMGRVGAAFVLLLALAMLRIVGRMTNGTDAFDALSLVAAAGDLIVVVISAYGLRRRLQVGSRR